MESLSSNVKKNGFEYILEKRSQNVAMYMQCYLGGMLPVAYEVFIVRNQKEGQAVIKGATIDFKAKELFPSDEEFGKTAWSFNSKERAEKCFEGLVKHFDDTIQNR
jgi:hypothetical protein